MDKASRTEAVKKENISPKTGEESYLSDYGRPMGSKEAIHPFEMSIAKIPPGKRHTPASHT